MHLCHSTDCDENQDSNFASSVQHGLLTNLWFPLRLLSPPYWINVQYDDQKTNFFFYKQG